MRKTDTSMRATPTRAGWLITTAAIMALGLAGVAQAASITTVTNDPTGAGQVAAAMAGSGANVVSADFTMAHPTAPANGVADAPLNVFPTDGTTFGILTTGDVQLADNPNNSGSSGLDQNGGTTTDGTHLRGDSDFDATILRIILDVPATANCLTFDFKFFSEEFPEFVGSAFNDAFIAELDVSSWTTMGSMISAPNNFAFDQDGDVISVNTAGFSGGNAAGTTYDGATVLLSASTPVTAGPHSLYLSIFDQGDQIYDSAVFLDNLRVGFVPNPAVNCVPGAQPVNFQMTLEPETDENPIGTPHTVTATLTDEGGTPIAGAAIDFEVSGANTAAGVDVTDANGEAEFTYTGTNIGDDTITACYNADASPDGSCEAFASATKTWTVGAPATLTLDPKTAVNPVDSEHCVTATVSDIGGNPVPGVTVRFSVTGSVTTDGSATTDANGQAEFCYDGPALPGEDVISAYADTDDDNVQDPGEPADTAAKTWVLPVTTPSCEILITNGGWIIAANGDRSTFGGNAKADADGNVSGQEEYQDHGPAQPFNLHGNVLAVVCGSDSNSASVFGQATVDGMGSHNYRINVVDNGEPGTMDRYHIIVDTGYDSGDQQLMGGNVQVRRTD